MNNVIKLMWYVWLLFCKSVLIKIHMLGPHVNPIRTDPKLVQNKGHGQLDITGLIH